MSVITSTCNQICNSPTNLSKSKMLYSFSKSARFSQRKRFYCDNFYPVPAHYSRATSFGFGSKFDFTKNNSKSPSPTAYNKKSEFERHSKKGTAFGYGREEMQITGPFVATRKNKNPGPGAYLNNSTLSHISYSMNGKNLKEDKQTPNLPGPGGYQVLYSINKKGKYFLSKHKNTFIRHFNDSIKREKNLENKVPGPGKYDTQKQGISEEGKYVMSRMQNPFVRSFGKSNRKPLAEKSMTPGPGNYRLPSEFGHYVSKTACGERMPLNVTLEKENSKAE